jgi:hypothetical protein
VAQFAPLLTDNSNSSSLSNRAPRERLQLLKRSLAARLPQVMMFNKKPHLEIHEHERRKPENAVMRKQYETLKSPDSLVRRWINLASEFLKTSPPKPKAE